MAYGKAQQEHAFKRIAGDVKKRDIAPINIIYGPEDYLVRWAAESIRKLYVDETALMFDFTKLDGGSCSSGDIISACETMPMLSEKRVVLVTDFPGGSSQGAKAGEDDESDEEPEPDDRPAGSLIDPDELTSYFGEFPEGTAVLILQFAGAPDKRRKFYKSAMAKGRDYNMTQLEVGTFNGFVKKRLEALGCKCDSRMYGAIAYATGYFDKESEYRIDNLIGDLAKLAAYCDGEVTQEAINETISGNSSVYVFEFVDAVLAGKRGKALTLFEQMMENEDNLFGILGLICSQFETVLLVSEMRSAGMNQREMATKLGIHEFRVKKAWEACRNYSAPQLRRILMKAYEINRNVKSGKFSIDASLELFIAGI